MRARHSAPFLLDTHIWFWYLTGSQRMPEELRSTIDEDRDALWLSPISIWELGMLHEHGRVRLAQGVREWIDEALNAFPMQEAPMNREIVLTSLEVELPHRDPADRFIAATALVYELTLMTVDERLTSARWLPTRSR